MVKHYLNATHEDALIFSGHGTTGAVQKFVSIMCRSNWLLPAFEAPVDVGFRFREHRRRERAITGSHRFHSKQYSISYSYISIAIETYNYKVICKTIVIQIGIERRHKQLSIWLSRFVRTAAPGQRCLTAS